MRRIGFVAAGLAVIAGMAVPAFASVAPTLGAGADVTICHATGSTSHPYVRISPSVSGIVHGHIAHQDRRDVIPPFTYGGRQYSQNWGAAGQVFLSGGCLGAPPSSVTGGGTGGGNL